MSAQLCAATDEPYGPLPSSDGALERLCSASEQRSFARERGSFARESGRKGGGGLPLRRTDRLG